MEVLTSRIFGVATLQLQVSATASPLICESLGAGLHTTYASIVQFAHLITAAPPAIDRVAGIGM
jgi:hypothetical protein